MDNSQPILASIVLVCWNNSSYLSRCLKSISSQTCQNVEVIIIDNGSIDNTIIGLDKKFPELSLRIKRLPSNLGFAVANNIGAHLARGKWLALLNVDAFPEPAWLEKLLLATEANSKYSVFTSRQIQAHTPKLLDGTGDSYHISGLAWRRYYNYSSNNIGFKKEEVFSACGAAALYSRDDFFRIGRFDEDYFSYFEDVDLGFRLRLAGKKCLYVPEAVVHHVGSASTGKRSDFSIYYGYRNMIWTFFKNMPSPLIWLLMPVHIGTVLFFITYLTLRGQGKVILRAVYDAIKGLSPILKKRKNIQRNIKIKPFELLNVMSTGLFEPFREFMLRNKPK